MDISYYIIIFIFGVIIGSFLNVVINRYNTGISLGGRSMCFSCGAKLSWYELIPIISFLIQRGKCRKCKSKISWQYLIVEFSTGILFLLTVCYLPFTGYFDIFVYFYLWIIICLLVVITVYDFRHKIIPDSFVYVFAGLSFLYMFANIVFSIGDFNKIDLLAGPILATPFVLLWLVSRGSWMGLGDAKLSLGIGWFLGLYYGLSAIILSFWIGAVFGVVLIIFGNTNLFLKDKKFTMKSEIPFGPFLILGIFLVLFFKIDALKLLM